MLTPQLKTATAKLHATLDACSALRVLKGASVTLAAYTTALAGHFRVFSQLEPAAHAHFPYAKLGLSLPSTAAFELIAADLTFLEAQIPSHTVAQEEAFPCTPVQAIGALYVLNGSALGGAVIAKNLERRLGLSQRRGLRFLTRDGDFQRETWEKFCAALDSWFISNPMTGPEAVHAAQKTFGAFIAQFKDET